MRKSRKKAKVECKHKRVTVLVKTRYQVDYPPNGYIDMSLVPPHDGQDIKVFCSECKKELNLEVSTFE